MVHIMPEKVFKNLYYSWTELVSSKSKVALEEQVQP
jgi:hypothetical protein